MSEMRILVYGLILLNYSKKFIYLNLTHVIPPILRKGLTTVLQRIHNGLSLAQASVRH